MTPDREPLAVMLYDRHVADIVDAGVGFTAVRYTEAALREPASSRLSLSLPVRRDPYPGAGVASRWVRSLLPEGRALAWAVQAYGVPEDDRFGLLAVLGADVAGAVRIVAQPGVDSTGSYEELSEDRLIEIVERAPEHGLALDPGRPVRLSLAGLQDKVALHRIGDTFYLPIDGAPSSLIVKPEPRAHEAFDPTGLATNELFCLTLAQECGLAAANATRRVFGETPAVLVERFDRQLVDGHLVRIHQEDLLATLGLDPWLRYEAPHYQRTVPAGGFVDANAVTATPGPTLRQLATVLTEHMGIANVIPFLEAVAYNVAIGNADSHARNYSVLLPPGGDVSLAPLYDLICTRLYHQLDADAPQRVNGKWALDEIGIEDLVAEGARWGLPERLARSRLTNLIEAIATRISATIDRCVGRGGEREVAEVLADRIRDRVIRLRD